MSKPSSQALKSEGPTSATNASRSGRSFASRVAFLLCFAFTVAATMLFLSAGTWKFWEAWVFLILVFVPTALISLHFLKHDPQMLERWLGGKDKGPRQRLLIPWSKPFMMAALLLPGLDHRLAWSHTLLEEVPLWVILVSDIFIFGSILFTGRVMEVDSLVAHTSQREGGRDVLFIGPYCLVRHPVYSGAFMIWLCTPLALGSYVALPAFVLIIPFYVRRLLREERTMRKHHAGYAAYCRSTPFRLFPFIW